MPVYNNGEDIALMGINGDIAHDTYTLPSTVTHTHTHCTTVTQTSHQLNNTCQLIPATHICTTVTQATLWSTEHCLLIVTCHATVKKNTKIPSPPYQPVVISLSLSLSLTHTHTYTHACAQVIQPTVTNTTLHLPTVTCHFDMYNTPTNHTLLNNFTCQLSPVTGNKYTTVQATQTTCQLPPLMQT